MIRSYHKETPMDHLPSTSFSRREFTKKAAQLGLLGFAGAPFVGRHFADREIKHETQILTSGPKHHFFGYFGICPWNEKETHLLSLETDFQDHMPLAGELAKIGLVDAQTGKFETVATTPAWNLQQGAMLHWHPKYPNQEILYNDEHEGRAVSTVLDLTTGQKRYLSNPISGLDHQGDYALHISYGRTGRLRKVVGYQGLADPNPNDPHPDNDGVFVMDLATGESRLVVSIRQVYEMLRERHPELENRHMWFNHTEFNDSGDRFFFLARTWNDNNRLQTGMFTANRDGSDLREAIPYGKTVSHFDWRNDRQIIATFNLSGKGAEHVLFTDGQTDYRSIGGHPLKFDGHCSFAPDQNWLVTDENHGDPPSKSLWIYNLAKDFSQKLGTFPMKEKKYVNSDVRCDLHPRWNRSGNKICIDALNPADWTRQLHVVHLDL